MKKLFHLALFATVALLLYSLTALEAGRSRAAPAEQDALAIDADKCRELALRCIGPTLTSGRVSAIAIDPRDARVWYVCGAAGGLWKTSDGGTSFKCISDHLGSFSLGAVALDPKNPDIVYLGTGEQQSQRSVDFGDGIYKSMDGGKTWSNIGLTKSEHIARIRIHPDNPNIVYVAAVGPLWASGGQRGVFKSIDGGKSWKSSLVISENTGVSDLQMDPGNPDILYAAAFQRRRHTGAALAGGPEGGIYKSDDGGAKWTKLTQGLPTANMGRISLAVSPQNFNTVYAHIAAVDGQGGFHRSDDTGASWTRVNDFAKKGKGGGAMPGADMYYGEMFADPHKGERVFVTSQDLLMTTDGGKTFSEQDFKKRADKNSDVHVDHHAMAFNLKNPNHILLGNDGGLYETKNGMKTWKHFPAIAVEQFYKMCVDNTVPFYYVYGGTQDNGSQRTASRTFNSVGIRTADSKKVGGGDGFQTRVDPINPKVFYFTSQNGDLRRSFTGMGGKGGGKSIQPGSKGGGGRWNWDTPYIISPHSNTRLYAASSIVYRSDNRGDTWTAISGDVTRNMDAMKIPLIGKVWGKDTPSRNGNTTSISTCNALEESPLKDGLIYVGTNDGVLQVTEDTGKNWRKIAKFPGIPELATISHICPSNHDVDTVYVSFIYYEYGDFKPYILKSTDRAKTWTSIASNLPARDFVWTIIEDPVNKNLLFAGTEFGVYFTLDGGKNWVQFKGGVPTISFRDMAIQKREADLVCCTFGRGFFILDDITPLRQATPIALAQEGVLFTPRQTYVYEQRTNIKKSANNNEMPNPPFGALITYHLSKDLGADTTIVLTVTDADGKKLRQLAGPATAGFHRVTWNLRPDGKDAKLVEPGTYQVSLSKQVKGKLSPLGETQQFEVVAVAPSAEQEMEEWEAFQNQIPEFTLRPIW